MFIGTNEITWCTRMDFVIVFVVDGVVIINSCNPKMLQCVLCHLSLVQIDVCPKGKIKNF
jgi:hypothetical protein